MKTIALHILDIVQNSIKAESTRICIDILDSEKKDSMRIIISDNGTGMNEETLKRAGNPFFTSRTTRKTGLGISLLRQQSEQAGGSLKLSSVWGEGTVLTSWFLRSHPDRQPLGDIAGTLTILIGANPNISFLYSHATDSGRYFISTDEVREYLATDDLSSYDLMNDLKEMINTNLIEIGVTELQYNT
jgi:hypothetical protein